MTDIPKVPQKIFSGRVIDGEKVGRTIGFPTANLDIKPSKEALPQGVYLARCWLESDASSTHATNAAPPSSYYNCLVYFGPRYIFGEIQNNFEVFIYDFDQQIYGQQLQVRLKEFIRAPINLSSLEALKTQLEKDKEAGLRLLRQKNK